MEIKKNSKFYKFLNLYWGNDMPKNGCELLWKTLTALLVYTTVSIVAAFAVVLLISILIVTPASVWFWDTSFPNDTAIILSMILWAAVGCLAISFYRITDHYRERVPAKEEKKPSLIAEYRKAAKEKICPLVEYVD